MAPRWRKRAWEIHQQYVAKARAKGSLASKAEITNFLTLAICGESGELANLVKKEWRGDAIHKEAVRDEMADIRIYLEHLATHLGIDLDQACERKLDIVAGRITAKKQGKGRSG
jgi:NTP pyrophosphatase (non-canonical NTP hydrolase)